MPGDLILNDESFQIRSAAGSGAQAADLIITPWREWASAPACAAWDALADGLSTPNPFFESWFLLPSLARFDPEGKVRIASQSGPDGLEALMPIQRARRYGRYLLPHLSVWLHANAFLGAPLVKAGSEVVFWEALFDWADRTAGTALFLHVPALPLDTPLADALVAVSARQSRHIAMVHREERAMLASPLAPAAYLEQAVPAKKRKEFRRQQARLAELGALTFTRQQDAQEIAGWTEHFLALEARGWKGSAGSALASAPETAGLFRKAMASAAARGRLERLSLDLDGTPIAMLATLIAPPGAFSFKTGFDEKFARFSPGVLLQLENLALLERAGIDWTDSCAVQGHPMIDSLWRERRALGRFSIAIGGTTRRTLFERLVSYELSRNPAGLP